MDPYELVPYGSRPFPEAHPDRMAVVARLFGLPSADPSTSRILELGCGSGMHLVPIAARLPGARCVGIDRSPTAIERSRSLCDQTGTENATFLEVDLVDAERALDRRDLPAAYDYIIVHGVYSWVADPLRDAILDQCSRWLATDGIAYVSYNTRPGWHLRGMLAEMLRFHAAGFESPEERVTQARALLQFLADGVPESDPYGGWLRREARLVAAQPDAWVFHDLLAEHNTALLVHEFVAHAERHGLRYVGDADLPSMLPDRLPAPLRRVLDGLGTDLLRAEQYLDFVLCRNFRRSLLCKPGPAMDRELAWPRLEGMYLRGLVHVVEEDDGGTEVFRTRGGDTLSTSVPLLRAALAILSEHRPTPIAFDALVKAASARAGGGDPSFDRELIGRNLLLCYARGAVELYPRRIAVASAPGDLPSADPAVRALAGAGDGVPSLLHEHVAIDGFDRSLLTRLDGTRTVDALIAELEDALATDRIVPGITDLQRLRTFVRDTVPDRLASYARAGLLV